METLAARSTINSAIPTIGRRFSPACTLACALGAAILSGCAQQSPIPTVLPLPTGEQTEEGAGSPIPLLPAGQAPAETKEPAEPVGPPLSPGIEIDSADLELFVKNQDAVLNSLIALANLPGPPEIGAEEEWRLVVEAAMVFADQRCEQYIEARYQAPDQVYQLDPSALKAIIAEQKRDYRGGLEAEAFQSRPTAMKTIQGYMALCTPASTEGDMRAAIAADAPAPARSIIDDAPRVPRRATVGLRDDLGDAYADDSFIVDYGLGITSAISDTERSLTLEEGQQIQLALCVAADGNFGRQGSRTRQAISELQGVLGFEQTGLLTKDQASALLSMSPCPQEFLTYYERITFNTPQAVQQLQKQINSYLAEVGISIQPTGILDDSTREAIKMVKRRAGIRVTPAVTADFASSVLARPARPLSSGALPPTPQQ